MKTGKRFTLLLGFALVLCVTQVSCTKNSKIAVIRIATQQMPNDENIAKAKNYFNSLGIKVNLLEFDASAVANAVASGSVDLALMGSAPATTAISNNLPVELIWIHGILGQSEALVVKDSANVNSVQELAGKKVAAPFGSTGHYSLLSALALADVAQDSLTILDMQPKDIFAAWQRGDIDAAYVWDPVLTNLLVDGKLLVSSQDLAAQGAITADVELVNKKFGEENPELIISYIRMLSKVQDEYRTDFNGMVSTIANYFKVTEQEGEVQLRGNIWLSAEEQLDNRYLGTTGNPGEFATTLKKTADFLAAQNSIKNAPDIAVFKNAINPHYIELSLQSKD